MKIIDNIQKGIFEIRSLIQADTEVRKLVFYDGADALSEPIPSIEQTKEHFTVSAIFDVTVPPFDKNTLISVTLSRANYDEESVMLRGLVKINILTRSELWELNGNKIRPLEIASLIVSILNNKKISSSHKLSFSNIELAIIDEDVNGYTATFFLEEGSGLDGQF